MEKAIENNVNIANPFEIQNNQAVDLFNGNISAMNTMNAGLRNLGSQTKFQYSQVYRYDLFNRLVSAQTYELDQSQAWTSTDKWLSNYKYDLNGNLLEMTRNGDKAGANLLMDKFSYNYASTDNNRLTGVVDAQGDHARYEDDRDGTANFTYDRSGRLTSDSQKGMVMHWRYDSKIEAVDKDGQRLMNFAYNPMGQRVKKEVISDGHVSTTFYFRDPSGNVMGVYTHKSGLYKPAVAKDQVTAQNKFLKIWLDDNQNPRAHLLNWAANVNATVTVCSGAGNTYNWSTLSNAQKKSILDNYILSAQNGDYECLNNWIQIFINSTGQSFGQRVDAQYAGNKKFNLANADVQELIGHAKNRLELSELYIYGSGRLGQTEPNLTLAADAERSFVYNPFTGAEIDPSTSVVPPVYTTSATHKSFIIGQKRYEISNNLGNVTSVITDRKFGVPLSSTDPTIHYYLADIVTATDYDPYGQALPGRVWNRTGYRFGFNGQEFDSELGEVWSAEFWEYDASLGRRWDIDPIDLPWQSPYVGLDNNPIFYSDPLGLATTGDGDGDKKGKKNKGKKNKTPEQAKESQKKVAGNVTDIAGHAGDVANSSSGTLIPDVVIEAKRPKSWIRRTGENVGKVVKWLWNNGGEILDGVAQEVVPVYGIIQDIKDLGTAIKERDGLAIGMGLIAFLPGGTLVKKLVHKIQDAKIIKPKKLKTDFDTKGGHPNDEFIDEEWNLPGSKRDPVEKDPRFKDFSDEIDIAESFYGQDLDEIVKKLNNDGVKTNIRQSIKGSKKAIIIELEGHKSIFQIQVHPGGGRHGGSYLKISTNKGIFKIVDKATYKATDGEKSLIIYK